MITSFKGKKPNQKRKLKNYKTLNTLLQSVDTIVINAANSTSLTLSITGIGFIILPLSSGIACTLSICNKVLHKLINKKYYKYKKQYEKDQQTIKSSDKLYRKSLEDDVIDKNQNESICKFFTKFLAETKNQSFQKKLKQKITLSFLSHIKLKFNLDQRSKVCSYYVCQ